MAKLKVLYPQKMKYFLFAILLILTVGSKAQFDYDIKSIEKSAEKLQSNQKKFKTLLAAEDSIVDRYIEGSKIGYHVYPTHPSFINQYDQKYSFQAPLAYYYIRLKQESDNLMRCKAYLDAISQSSNTKMRQQFVFYLMSEEGQPLAFKKHSVYWNGYISRSATISWVDQYLSDSLNSNLPNDTYHLIWRLVHDWAEQLNPANKSKAYQIFRSFNTGGPGDGNNSVNYRLLYRIDHKKAQEEVLSYWNKVRNDKYKTSYNYEVTNLLYSFKGKNPKLARKVIQIRNTTDTSIRENRMVHIPKFNSMLLSLDPKVGKEELTVNLEKAIKGKLNLDQHYHAFINIIHLLKGIYTEKEDIELLVRSVKAHQNIPGLCRYEMLKILYEKDQNLFIDCMVYLKSVDTGNQYKDDAYRYAINELKNKPGDKNQKLLRQIESQSNSK